MRVRLFLALSAVTALVALLTVVLAGGFELGGDGGAGGDQIVGGPDGSVAGGSADGSGAGSTTSTAVVPSGSQVSVRGTVTSVLLTGAVLQPREVATPLTVVSDRGFGNGGELTTVQVDGRPSTIVWDGGRPLVLSSGGPLVLDPVDVALVPEGLQLVLGGGAHALTPGPYQLDTPVAVGSDGIATPHDAVAFEAVAGSLLEARGDASLLLGPGAPHHVVGPGRVLLAGALELTDAAGTRTGETLATEEAAYDLTFTAGDDGTWTVTGIVDGPVVG